MKKIILMMFVCSFTAAIFAQEKTNTIRENDQIVAPDQVKIEQISKVAQTNDVNTVVSYDFTVAGAAYTTGPDPMVEVEPGVWAMIAGDGNSDGSIDASDQNSVWRPANGQVWVYETTGLADFNLDKSIDANDQNLFWRPNNGKSTQVP